MSTAVFRSFVFNFRLTEDFCLEIDTIRFFYCNLVKTFSYKKQESGPNKVSKMLLFTPRNLRHPCRCPKSPHYVVEAELAARRAGAITERKREAVSG